MENVMRKKLIVTTLAIALAVSGFSSAGVSWPSQAAYREVAEGVNPYTKSTYTHNEAFNGKNIYLGIDVSYHQGTIDWAKVKADGVQFAILRVGYRGYSNGRLCADPKFEEYIAGAASVGLPVGLYYYTEAINTKEAIEEAQYCINAAKNYKISLPIVYDYEHANKTGRKYKAKLSKAAATSLCKAFCETIEAAGYTPMVYANKTDLTSTINGAELAQSYKIWLAQYNTKTTYTGAYEYWQYSSKGSIDGISGNVDCNFWYTSNSISNIANMTSIKKATVKAIANKKYTGKAITPALSITYNGKKLKKNVDYKLSYSNNKNIGQATVTITGIDNFYGTKKVTFKIVPKKVSSFKKKSGTKQITLTWAKNSTATGYQIYRKATYNGKTYKKVKTFAKNTKITWTDSKLKSNREYYYCIRAYTKVGGKNYYSDYTYLTAPTLPGSKKAVTNKKIKLYKEPTAKGTVLVKIPKKTKVTYLGRTYTTGTKNVYHIKCTIQGKTYKGYVPSNTKLTF